MEETCGRVCVRCGSTFQIVLNLRGRPKFCSTCIKDKERERLARRHPPLLARDCEWCGKSYTPRRRRDSRFCSRTCVGARTGVRHQPQRARVLESKTCELCDASFLPWSSLGKYCSKLCISRAGGIRDYGISVPDYRSMLKKQNGDCASCGVPLDGIRSNIDHDHSCCPGGQRACGKCVRGILCSGCNIAAGHIEKRGAAVLAYLARTRTILEVTT